VPRPVFKTGAVHHAGSCRVTSGTKLASFFGLRSCRIMLEQLRVATQWALCSCFSLSNSQRFRGFESARVSWLRPRNEDAGPLLTHLLEALPPAS